MDSQDNIRKRVCKACDRCRLKKSKCDGASPCSRCKADNAICVFGERKKSQDKVYPKGYVEMLEQQQTQLVAGLQKLYGLSLAGKTWPGAPLRKAHGDNPYTHDILERLNLLHASADGNYEQFEEDCGRMQQKLLEGGAPYTRRRGSMSSDSEHVQTPPSLSCSGTPTTTTSSPCQETFPQQNRPTSPRMDSPLMDEIPFGQPEIVSSIKQEAPALSVFSNLNPAMLSQSSWMPDPMIMDDQIAYNTYNTYNHYDNNAMMIGNDPIMPAWVPVNELEYGSYLNNG